jgi:hypothetical protein
MDDSVKYQLRVQGLRTPHGTIPVRALLELFQSIVDCTERRLRLSIAGISVSSGRPPAWLTEAVDLRFTGVGKGSTTLDIEAPTLGSILGERIQQQDFWVTPPKPADTALTLLAETIRDTTRENAESDFYDAGVLKSLLSLRPFLRNQAESVELSCIERPDEHVTVTMADMEKADRLRVRTPETQAFLVSGHLDSIQHSTKRFRLALPDGQIIPGRINEEFLAAENLREFWGKEVTVRGMVHFKPSGHVQLLAAESIRAKGEGEELFAYMPRVQSEAAFVSETAQSRERRDWLQGLWDNWPGDEPVEEILRGLKE